MKNQRQIIPAIKNHVKHTQNTFFALFQSRINQLNFEKIGVTYRTVGFFNNGCKTNCHCFSTSKTNCHCFPPRHRINHQLLRIKGELIPHSVTYPKLKASYSCRDSNLLITTYSIVA
jgi:hypothetical protein